MLEDDHRGYGRNRDMKCRLTKYKNSYILELLATKLLCLQQPLQIIGMSATLSVRYPQFIPSRLQLINVSLFQNISDLGSWLQAYHYDSTYRPIPLQDFLVYENEVYNEHDRLIAHLPSSDIRELRDPVTNAMVSLVYECVAQGHSALVFCPSRDITEKIAV